MVFIHVADCARVLAPIAPSPVEDFASCIKLFVLSILLLKELLHLPSGLLYKHVGPNGSLEGDEASSSIVYINVVVSHRTTRSGRVDAPHAVTDA